MDTLEQDTVDTLASVEATHTLTTDTILTVTIQ